MMTTDPVKDILAEIKAKKHGYFAAGNDAAFRKILLNLSQSHSLTPVARAQIRGLAATSGRLLFTKLFEEILAKVENFEEPAEWALFWSLASGCHKAIESVGSSEEKELNGFLIGRATSAVEYFRRPLLEGRQSNLNELLLFNYANLAVSGLEGHTGADFGLILEINSNGKRRIVASLVQAKRSLDKTAAIFRKAGDSNQLEKLSSTGGGMYLFYTEFLKPKGLPFSSKSAELAARQAKGETQRVDVLELSSEFASHVALAITNGAPGGRCFDTEEEAISFIFNAKASEDTVGHLMVCIMDMYQYSPADRQAAEQRWNSKVEALRATRVPKPKRPRVAPKSDGPKPRGK